MEFHNNMAFQAPRAYGYGSPTWDDQKDKTNAAQWINWAHTSVMFPIDKIIILCNLPHMGQTMACYRDSGNDPQTHNYGSVQCQVETDWPCSTWCKLAVCHHFDKLHSNHNVFCIFPVTNSPQCHPPKPPVHSSPHCCISKHWRCTSRSVVPQHSLFQRATLLSLFFSKTQAVVMDTRQERMSSCIVQEHLEVYFRGSDANGHCHASMWWLMYCCPETEEQLCMLNIIFCPF